MKRLSLCSALAISICLVAGCGGSDRFAVSGKVKLKDQPLETGIVLFEPLEGQDTGGNAVIEKGEFTMPREAGLKPGKYRVRITSGDGKTAVNPVDPNEPPGPGGGGNIISKELVPPAWNTQSKQEVTVKAEGENTFNFDIK